MRRIQQGKRLSQAILANGFVFSSGLATENPGSSIKAQTAEILQKIDDLLTEAGIDRSCLVRVDIALADIADYQQMNAAWDAWINASSAAPPARTCVEARAAAKDYYIEMSFIAVASNSA